MAGRKTWSSFDVVTADDFNGYLADQTVMRFATASERSFAIPTPAVGMMTSCADTASGAPYYWDGGAWVAVAAGATLPHVLAACNPMNVGGFWASSAVAPVANTWYQMTPATGPNIVVTRIRFSTVGAFGAAWSFEVGTGASGSEVTRAAGLASSTSIAALEMPYGMWIPAGTRMAMRTTTAGLTAAITADVEYVSYGAGVQYRGGIMPSITATTAYVQVAAAPPLAGGVWVTGSTFGSPGTHTFGLGSAGSEVAVSGGYTVGSNSGSGDRPIVPFWWPAGTRLAAKVSAGTSAMSVIWRESLANT